MEGESETTTTFSGMTTPIALAQKLKNGVRGVMQAMTFSWIN